jgi:hypothetical protein
VRLGAVEWSGVEWSGVEWGAVHPRTANTSIIRGVVPAPCGLIFFFSTCIGGVLGSSYEHEPNPQESPECH